MEWPIVNSIPFREVKGGEHFYKDNIEYVKMLVYGGPDVGLDMLNLKAVAFDDGELVTPFWVFNDDDSKILQFDPDNFTSEHKH